MANFNTNSPHYSSKIEGVHKEFQKFVNAEICRYVSDRCVLLLISRSEQLAKRAGMMQEMHFRNLSQKVKELFFDVFTGVRINEMYFFFY